MRRPDTPDRDLFWMAVPKDGSGNLKLTTYNADGSLVTGNGYNYNIGATSGLAVSVPANAGVGKL